MSTMAPLRSGPPASPRSLAEQDHLDGVEEDGQVEQERHVLDVVEVELVLLLGVLDGRSITELDLGPAGDARFHAVALVVVGDDAAELLDEVWPLRPRPDEAHLAAQHVEELRQLVEAALA